MFPFRTFRRKIPLSFSEPGTYDIVVFVDSIAFLGKAEEMIHTQNEITIVIE